MAVIFYPPRTGGGGGGGGAWGTITGTLSDQTDLQTALDGKSDVGHTHANLSSLLGFVTSTHTSSPNNLVHASRLLVVAGTVDADIVLSPKGAGAFIVDLSDSSISGGNKRGVNAVDLQLTRTNETKVASGEQSSLLGGASNIASALASSVVGGQSNTASAIYSIVLGGSNSTASGQGSAVIGGTSGTASGVNCVVIGGSLSNATGLRSATIGGTSNSNSGERSVILGGSVNTITGDDSVLFGGISNVIDGNECAIIVSDNSEILNTGISQNAVILGGADHSLNGARSIILGGRGVTLGSQADDCVCFHAGNANNTKGITVNTSNTVVFNNADLWLSNNDNTPRTLRFYEQYNTAGTFPNGTNYVAFRAPNSIAADVTWTLPNADGSNGQLLQTNGAGTLSWVTPSGGGSNVSMSYVKDIITNLNSTGNYSFNHGSQEVLSFQSTGRAFWGYTDGTFAVLYTATSINGTYSQIHLATSGGGSYGLLQDIGPSSNGFVVYRSASTSNWVRWNGTSMVAVTSPFAAGTVNAGIGIGYNGNFAYVAFGSAGQEGMRYSTDNGATWSSGGTSWFHTSGSQMSNGYIAVGVVGSGSTWVFITQLNTSPVSANCSYGTINGTATKQLFPNGYINPLGYASNGTAMYVYFDNGVLARTTDGATWTYLPIGVSETVGMSSVPWNIAIRSSDVLLFSPFGKVYSIAQDLSAVNWVRIIDSIKGGSGAIKKSDKFIPISDEIYTSVTSGVTANSIGYFSSSIEKYTFS